jgi:hypothetical protein
MVVVFEAVKEEEVLVQEKEERVVVVQEPKELN